MKNTNYSKLIQNLTPDDAWAFENNRSGESFTHSYHRYPAKFVPHLVNKLLDNYAKQKDVVADVFAGCGTTLVECKLKGYKSFGIDINPVAEIITKAKITPIKPEKLERIVTKFLSNINDYHPDIRSNILFKERLKYWFDYENLKKIKFIIQNIKVINDIKVKIFLLCAVSNILKTTSRWLQSSTKPQIDPNKCIYDPFIEIQKQIKSMVKRNRTFYDELKTNNNLEVEANILQADAKNTGLESRSINIIITSPPYVTSYQYADIHQLTGLFFDYFDDLSSFRKNFIGAFKSSQDSCLIESKLGKKMVNELKLKNKRLSYEVSNYFNDMNLVFKEAKRILKRKAYFCIVIGNTKLRDVNIKNAEVFCELLLNLNFEIKEVIKRKIPVKQLPTVRDKKTKRFCKMTDKNKSFAYPEEYIIIARKK